MQNSIIISGVKVFFIEKTNSLEYHLPQGFSGAQFSKFKAENKQKLDQFKEEQREINLFPKCFKLEADNVQALAYIEAADFAYICRPVHVGVKMSDILACGGNLNFYFDEFRDICKGLHGIRPFFMRTNAQIAKGGLNKHSLIFDIVSALFTKAESLERKAKGLGVHKTFNQIATLLDNLMARLSLIRAKYLPA